LSDINRNRKKKEKMKRVLITTVMLAGALIVVAGHRQPAAQAEKPSIKAIEQTAVNNVLDPQKNSGDELREEFHQSYPLSASGRVSLENINGGVRIAVWDQNEVKVDAVKRAYRRERLDEARIEVNATADVVRIATRYPDRDQTFTDETPRRYENPATVEYSLTVPRKARLESIELINGSLDINGVEGDVKASSINGRLKASGLTGEAKLSTVNGSLEATFSRLDESKSISLNSVNGSVVLIIPSDANAQVRANTVHGGITNDFGLPVQDGEYVGHELNGQLGAGGPRIRLGNVNGRITIKHAEDGRATSRATSLLPEKEKYENEVAKSRAEARRLAQEAREQALDSARATMDAQRIARDAQLEAQREVAQAQREAAQAMRESQREFQQAQIQVQREVQRQAREAARAVRVGRGEGMGRGEGRGEGSGRLVDRESKTFTVSGTPSVNVGTFDGSVVVRGWDKQEVSYTATKRAGSDEALKRITIESSQQGSAVSIIAKSDDDDGSASLEIYVPRNANLHLSSQDGRLSVQGVSGELVARTGDGSIEVEGGNGRLQANTGDGSIRITSFQGEIDARTGDGSISLNGSFTAVSARTGDGSIVLSTPAASNFVIETNADSITNEGLNISEETPPSNRVKRWRVGSGGAVFTLHTGDGRVILRSH
jgi:DUF4097 and DUF4098 domain-containing protein YvlB